MEYGLTDIQARPTFQAFLCVCPFAPLACHCTDLVVMFTKCHLHFLHVWEASPCMQHTEENPVAQWKYLLACPCQCRLTWGNNALPCLSVYSRTSAIITPFIEAYPRLTLNSHKFWHGLFALNPPSLLSHQTGYSHRKRDQNLHIIRKSKRHLVYRHWSTTGVASCRTVLSKSWPRCAGVLCQHRGPEAGS